MVREAARSSPRAWSPQFEESLANGNSIAVRNAADFLGATRTLKALPNLRAAIDRGGLDPEARARHRARRRPRSRTRAATTS